MFGSSGLSWQEGRREENIWLLRFAGFLSVFIGHFIKNTFYIVCCHSDEWKQWELKTENLFQSLKMLFSWQQFVLFAAVDFSVEIYIYWLIQASLPAAHHWSEQQCIGYVQLGIYTVEGANENFTMDHNGSFFNLGWFNTKLWSSMWIYWTFSVSIFTSSVTVPFEDIQHVGPGEPHWPRSATLLLSDLVGANSCLAQTQSTPTSEPRKHYSPGGTTVWIRLSWRASS